MCHGWVRILGFFNFKKEKQMMKGVGGELGGRGVVSVSGVT